MSRSSTFSGGHVYPSFFLVFFLGQQVLPPLSVGTKLLQLGAQFGSESLHGRLVVYVYVCLCVCVWSWVRCGGGWPAKERERPRTWFPPLLPGERGERARVRHRGGSKGVGGGSLPASPSRGEGETTCARVPFPPRGWKARREGGREGTHVDPSDGIQRKGTIRGSETCLRNQGRMGWRNATDHGPRGPRPAGGGRRSRGRADVPRTRLSNRHRRRKTPKNAFRRPSRTLPRSPTHACRRLALSIEARASRQASDHHRVSFPSSFVLFGQTRRSQARPIVRLQPGTTRSKGDRSAEGEMRAVVEDEATVRPRRVACRRMGRID